MVGGGCVNSLVSTPTKDDVFAYIKYIEIGVTIKDFEVLRELAIKLAKIIGKQNLIGYWDYSTGNHEPTFGIENKSGFDSLTLLGEKTKWDTWCRNRIQRNGLVVEFLDSKYYKICAFVFC